MKRLLPFALSAALLTGCKIGPNYHQPIVPTPADWRTQSPTGAGSLADVGWWEFFKDPVLTNLISTALTNNKDMGIAAANIEVAFGGYRSQRSYLFPSVDAAASWTRARVGNLPPGGGTTGNQFDIIGLLSYEVDIWGRIRRLTEAARAQLLASEEGSRTVAISLVAGVATTYFDLRRADEQLVVAKNTLLSRRESLQLALDKFDHGNGIVSELDVRQAETLVFGAQSAVAALERQIPLTENALSVLLGANPGAIPRGATLANQWQPDAIPAGLPSDLLLRRPDVLAAEQNLIAANANIGAARAAYFPTISLTAALGVQSVDLNDLFTSGLARTWKFAPQVAGPIFNAGRISAGVQVARAQHVAALLQYEQAIQNAFREVDDALVSVQKLREQLAADEADVAAERQRLELSLLRYNGGVTDYSEVLDAQRSLFATELNTVQTRRDVLAAITQLYKALGGGWPAEQPTQENLGQNTAESKP